MTDKIEVPRKLGTCPICNGNDADIPCAYATERPGGCLRVERLRQDAAQSAPICCYECATPTQRMSWMIVCPHCGNKRCPHAESHRSACTGSNEPNQTASPCCNNPTQCSEPCGDLGKSAEHAQPEQAETWREEQVLADLRQLDQNDETMADRRDVDRFSFQMKRKLALAAMKGRGGWRECDPAVLSKMLRDHVEKGDPRDVANFCMFLWVLGSPIHASPADEELRRDAAIPFDLMREVSFINDKYTHWREVYPLAVDDPEYDCFAAGFKIALASVEAAITAEREGGR